VIIGHTVADALFSLGRRGLDDLSEGDKLGSRAFWSTSNIGVDIFWCFSHDCPFPVNSCGRVSLNDLESKLDPSNFIRIHRSHIVKVAYIRDFVKWFAGRYKVRLKDKNATELTVSRGYTDQIRRL
jgi:hypothetical protein